MFSDDFGISSVGSQQLYRCAWCAGRLYGGSMSSDGHPDDSVREHDRFRAGQEVGGDEFVGRCPTLVRRQAGESDGIGERGLVAEHRRGFRKVLRRRTQSGQPTRDLAPH